MITNTQSSCGAGPDPETDQPPVLEATVQAFLDAVAATGTSPLHELSFEQARESLLSLQRSPVTAPNDRNQQNLFQPDTSREIDEFSTAQM
jgi:hypothetical protein